MHEPVWGKTGMGHKATNPSLLAACFLRYRSHLALSLWCSKQAAPAVSPNTVLWTCSWRNSLAHHYLQAVRTPGNTAPLLHSSRLTPPLVAAPSTTHPASTRPASPGVQEKIPSHTPGHGAPRSQMRALTTGSILALFLRPTLSRSRAPFLVVLQPVDKYATEAVSNQAETSLQPSSSG